MRQLINNGAKADRDNLGLHDGWFRLTARQSNSLVGGNSVDTFTLNNKQALSNWEKHPRETYA